MENNINELYQQIMSGYIGDDQTNFGLICREDGSYVQIACEGFYNNGEAAYVAEEN